MRSIYFVLMMWAWLVSASVAMAATSPESQSACQAAMTTPATEETGLLDAILAASAPKEQVDGAISSLLRAVIDETNVQPTSAPKSGRKQIFGLDTVSLPPGYNTDLVRAAVTEEALRGDLDQILRHLRFLGGIFDSSIEARLDTLARLYDMSVGQVERRELIMRLIMSSFSIRVEGHYLNMILSAHYSRDFKIDLEARLRKLFKYDPSWLPPLDSVKRAAGI